MSDKDTTTRTGQLAEDQAARFLEQKQLTVIARNYRCRVGEIDLICQDGGTLVFVEVRMRRNSHFGGAAASVTPVKQGRLVRAARHYLLTKGKSDHDCRFDCVFLDGEIIEWIKDAFSAQ